MARPFPKDIDRKFDALQHDITVIERRLAVICGATSGQLRAAIRENPGRHREVFGLLIRLEALHERVYTLLRPVRKARFRAIVTELLGTPSTAVDKAVSVAVKRRLKTIERFKKEGARDNRAAFIRLVREEFDRDTARVDRARLAEILVVLRRKLKNTPEG